MTTLLVLPGPECTTPPLLEKLDKDISITYKRLIRSLDVP